MDKTQLKELIRNQYTGQHEDLLLKWISSPDFESDLDKFIHEDLLEELKAGRQVQNADLNHLLDEILAISRLRLSKSESQSLIANMQPLKSKPVHKVSRLNTLLKVAASIALILSLFFVLNTLDKGERTIPQVTSEITKSNPAGRKSTIFLADGSKIYLNSASSVSYAEPFSKENREVMLEGEAFFEVAHNPKVPFIVTSGSISTIALGTSFNIKNYQDEDLAVSLVTGSVKVDENLEGSENEFVLKPGEKVVYSRQRSTFNKISHNDSEDLLWKEGFLSFSEVGLKDLKKDLERWYGVEITIAGNKPAEFAYTGIFKDQSLEQVLTAMGFTLNFDFALDEKQVTIDFK